MVVFFPSVGFAQLETSTCPPPLAQPTVQEIQERLKTARDRGFLWRIEKGGSAAYLYGSMHVGKLDWVLPGPKTSAALQSSGVIALELDVLDPQVQAQMADPSRFGIKNVALPQPLKQRMEVIANRVCAPVAALAGMHPLMQLIAVTILDARFSNLEAGYGTEMFLSGFAKGAKKSLDSLETPEMQVRALFAGEDKDILEAIERGITLFESGKQRAQTERLVNAWAASDLEELQRYEKWCECMNTAADREYFKRLFDDRNPHLAAGIDKLIRADRKVFSAVGALHMVGSNSVPKLLEKMGYSVERVAFDK